MTWVSARRMSEYKPNISKIKIHRLKAWIEDRLTALLDGLEDEILWGMVYNFLEDAQRKAIKEGPEVNPTGGLDRRAITEALLGFLGQAKASKFVQELFEKLKETEMTDEALEIISTARKPEKSLSERVEREIRQADRPESRHERRSGRDEYESRHRYESRDSREVRERYDSRESRERYDSHRDRDHRDRERHDERNRYESNRPSRDREVRGRSYERLNDRDREPYESRHSRDSRSHRSRSRSRPSHSHSHSHSQSHSNSHSRSYSRIPSSNSPPRRAGSISPVPVRHLKASPGFERTREPSWEKETAPVAKAPQVKETIPSALEAALRERAKKSKNL